MFVAGKLFLHMRNIAPGLICPIDYTFPTRQEYVFLERYLCWPEDVPNGNIKRSNKESLCKIIHAYLNANDHGEATSYRDHLPHGSLRQLRDEWKWTFLMIYYQKQIKAILISAVNHFFQFLQSESTSHQDSHGITEPTPSLANLVRAKPLEPVLQFSPILSEVQCVRKLLAVNLTMLYFVYIICQPWLSSISSIKSKLHPHIS